MIDRALLLRIRKCFALSASANEHEAAAALAKARDLMHEHGLTDVDLAMAEVEESAVRGSRAQRPPLWEQYLSACVRRALAVIDIIGNDGDRRFIGRGPSAEIAAYAFVALFRRLKAARAEYIRVHLRRCTLTRKRIRADAFCEGWANSVFSKIARLAPKAEADPAVSRYLAARYPDLVTVSGRSSATGKRRVDNDRWRGWDAGRNVDLHGGVAGNATAPVLLSGKSA